MKTIKLKIRNWLRAWLGIDDVDKYAGNIHTQVLTLKKQRDACMAVDIAMQHDKGYLVLLMPKDGNDLVKVWEIPPKMPISQQEDFIFGLERMVGGPVSLLDAPRGLREDVKLRHQKMIW